MFKIAIDLGYGYVKGINENGKTVLIRTAIGTGGNRQLTTVFGGSEKSREHIVISQNETERQYFIGNLARKEARDCSSPFEKNKIDNPSTKVLLAAAFAVLMEDNNGPVHLITGPPLLDAVDQMDSYKNVLTDYHSVLRFVGEEKNYDIKFDRVSVFPQGAAVAYHLLRKQPELAMLGKTFVIIDLGYKTTEIYMFEIVRGNKIMPISTFSILFELGMNLMEKVVDEAFFQKTSSKLIPSTVDLVLNENPVLIHQGKEVNLSDVKNAAKEELVRKIISGITQVLGEQIGFIDKIIFAGGVMQDQYIVNLIKTSLKSNFLIVEDSQFANARGMLEVASTLEEMEIWNLANGPFGY